jgi:large subunit ribosomal protein L24e
VDRTLPETAQEGHLGGTTLSCLAALVQQTDFTAKQEVAKKRTRRTVKAQRAIVGASLDVIKERRSMRPEARAAARSEAIKDAKEKKAAAESKKKAEKAKSAASAAKGQTQRIQSKQGARGAPSKIQAKTR